MKKLLILLCSLPLMLLSGCEDSTPATGKCSCLSGAETIAVDGIQGTMLYVEEASMWGVRHVQPGTIDCVDIYLIENVSGSLRKDGRQVTFSGSVMPSELKSPVAGTTYYCVTECTDLVKS